MKYILLLFFIAHFTISTSQEKKDNDCPCKNYYTESRSHDTPLLEFHRSFIGTELKRVTEAVLSSPLTTQSQKEVKQSKLLYIVHISGYKSYSLLPDIGLAQGKDTAAISDLYRKKLIETNAYVKDIRFVWSQKRTSLLGFSDMKFYTLYAVHGNKKLITHMSMENIDAAIVTRDSISNKFNVLAITNREGLRKLNAFGNHNNAQFITVISYNKMISSTFYNWHRFGGQILVAEAINKEEAFELRDKIRCYSHMQRVGKEAFEKEMEECE